MIYSRYNVYFKQGTNLVIYNTLNKQLIRLPEKLEKFLEPEIMPDIIKKVLSNFIVESEDYEQKNMKYLMNSMIYQNSRINITLMMTMNCNFKCVYCFENWLSDSERTKQLDENEFIHWLKYIIMKYHIKQVDLCFHGGEPMLEIEKIKKISDELRCFFDRNHIFYLFTAVTNGYLLNQKNVEILRNSKIKVVQITIDGVGAVHDKRRMLKNGNGTFDTIIGNIGKLKGIKCYVNIVYDNSNRGTVKDLIDFFKNNQMQDKIDLIVIGSTKPIKLNNDLTQITLSDVEDGNIRISLLKYIIKNGFKTINDLEYQLCTLKQKNSLVISSQGMVYKCISGVGNRVFELCKFSKDVDPFEKQAEFIEGNGDITCEKCSYMPICNKFCLYESFVKNDNKKICKKQYWDNYIRQYIEMLIDEKYTNGIIKDPNKYEWEAGYNE